jgi:peptidylprolyl isomerase
MFFKKKRRRRQKQSSAWMNWIIIACAGIAFISSLMKGTPDNPNPVREAVDETATTLAEKAHINFDAYKAKIFPQSYSALRILDKTVGTGAPAVCGQTVTLTYTTTLEDGTAVDDSADKEKPLSFRIGEDQYMPALEQGVIGMKTGGQRTIFSMPSMAYGTPQFARAGVPDNVPVHFETELLDVTPVMPELKDTPYRIADIRGGLGAPLLCGQTASVHITIWGVDGRKIYSSKDNDGKPLDITPGKSQVFLGLEEGLVGILHGGLRMLVVPPSFQKTMDGKPATIEFPLPENETVLVDIESVP